MARFYDKPQSASLAFLIAGAIWFAVGTVYGLLSAIHFVSPEVLTGHFVFGRERPVHVNTVIFGFVISTLIGCGYHYVPALLRTRLWSERLGWASFVLWTLTVLSGPLTFPFGLTQGREYTEYIFPADVSLTLSVLLTIVNLVMTIANRREDHLYVSIWYFTGMFLWTAFVYPIGNVMWHPSVGALPGLFDSIVLWFYGHNLPGLVLTPLAVGAAYFIIPRITRTPLYSYLLGLIGFWSLVALYTHIGGHHVLQAPIPHWLRAMSIIDSIAMVVPVFTAVLNLWLSSRGRGGLLLADPAGRWVMIGLVWYIVTCIQGPMQSLPFVQRITHFTNWTIGHSHIAVLGFSGYIALGGLWHILPLVTGRRLYSDRLVNLQFGLVTLGLTGFFFDLTIAGLIQGGGWYNGTELYRVLPEIFPYMVLRLAFGLSIMTGAFIGLANVFLTMRRGERFKVTALEGGETP